MIYQGWTKAYTCPDCGRSTITNMYGEPVCGCLTRKPKPQVVRTPTTARLDERWRNRVPLKGPRP